MAPRYRASPALMLTLGILAALAPLAHADVFAWYELVGSSSPGPRELIVEQGAPGQPLRITTDGYAGPYELRIRLVVDIDADERLLAYAVDLFAPSAANLTPHSFNYVSPMDFDMPVSLAPGPGMILGGAAQLNLVDPLPDGEIELNEFVLTVSRPPGNTIEIHSAIGPAGWARDDGQPVAIHFGDSPVMDGWQTGFVSTTPGIIIDQFIPPPPPPPNPEGNGPSQPPAQPTTPDPPAPPADAPTSAPEAAPQSAAVPPENLVNQTDGEATGSGKMIDRDGLRSFLGALFGLSMKDMPASAIVPAGFSWLLGVNIHAALSVFDALGLPIRSILFEMTYGWMDAILP